MKLTIRNIRRENDEEIAIFIGKMDDLLTELKKTQPTIYFELEGEKEDNEEIKRYSDYIRRKVNERKNIAGEDIYCSNCGKEEVWTKYKNGTQLCRSCVNDKWMKENSLQS